MKTNISNLTYEKVSGELNKSTFNMHEDATDCLRTVANEKTFNEVKERIMSKYGDVEIEVNQNESWFDQVKILDQKYNQDKKDFVSAKQAWCNKYGCE